MDNCKLEQSRGEENQRRSRRRPSKRCLLSETGGSTRSGFSAQSRKPHATGKTGKTQVWATRLLFLLFLVLVAGALGGVAHYLLKSSEDDLAEQQYDALADRALDLVKDLSVRRRVAVKSMAQIAASAYPAAEMWPEVAIPAFETFAEDLLKFSGCEEISFHPMVRPQQVQPGEQSSFEAFAYDYYHSEKESPFPPDTSLHSFGTGIWKPVRLHDTTGITDSWDSPNPILFPELQNSDTLGQTGSLLLLFNAHSDPSKGQALDNVIDCSKQRNLTGIPDSMDCGVVTEISSFNRASFVVQPIYPVRDPLHLTGAIMSKISWDNIISRLFEGTVVTGVTVVLEAEGRSYSYDVNDGISVFLGEGDFHETSLSEYARSIVLEGADLSGASSRRYTLTVYPTNDFFEVYSTGNPTTATIGAVLIVFVTSLIFCLYDFFVRREFSANEQLLEAKRQFMRFVSHEVRTPLNAVCMGLTLLQEETKQTAMNKNSHADSSPSKNTTDCLELIEEISLSARSSVSVLNDLLNYDKIETNSLSLELTTFSIADLVLETLHEFKLSARKKAIELHVDVSLMMTPASQQLLVVGDKIRITQVLRNLASNAIKFTPAGGSVTVKVSRLNHPASLGRKEKLILESGDEVEFSREGSVQISFTDTGAGMSQDQVKRLFKEGIQFNVNELQAGQGSGLGLYISKGFVTQHGGDLAVASGGIGRGTTFTCSLPLYHAPDVKKDDATSDVPMLEPCIPTDEATNHFVPLRILIVDDVATNRKMLSRLATKRGHEVEMGEDGREAVEKVAKALEENKPYDTILIDHEMPRLRGPEAVSEIRSLGCDAFICGITGNLLPEDQKHFTSSGANFVLPKPVDFRKLEELWMEHGVHNSH